METLLKKYVTIKLHFRITRERFGDIQWHVDFKDFIKILKMKSMETQTDTEFDIYMKLPEDCKLYKTIVVTPYYYITHEYEARELAISEEEEKKVWGEKDE